MDNQIDTLNDFEIELKQDNWLIYSISCLSALLIVSFIIFSFWPFNITSLYQVWIDEELQMLSAIHVIYPTIALGLFINRNKLGWSLMVFCSMINATYGLFAYCNDLMAGTPFSHIIKDKMFFFFLIHVIMIVMIFNRSVLRSTKLSRKYIFYTAAISGVISASFLFLLLATYN